MKRLFYIVLGIAIGSVALFAAGYIFSFVLVHFNVRLYQSEDDQQRNFNIFLGLWLLIAGIGGYLGFRKSATAQPIAAAEPATGRPAG